MEKIEDLMSKRKWRKMCLRTNLANPEDIVTYGAGQVKSVKLYSNVLKNREKEPELWGAIKETAPELFGNETQLTLNKDLCCKRHRDRGNKERSWILWLGGFAGGALKFDNGDKVEGKYEWHQIDGRDYQWNDPREGSKYSTVHYRGFDRPKARTLNNIVKAKKAAQENSQISV